MDFGQRASLCPHLVKPAQLLGATSVQVEAGVQWGEWAQVLARRHDLGTLGVSHGGLPAGASEGKCCVWDAPSISAWEMWSSRAMLGLSGSVELCSPPQLCKMLMGANTHLSVFK